MAHPIHREIQQPRLNYEQVRALISSEPSCASLPDRQNGYTPLHTAARRGDPQLIRVLIECGAELEARIAGSGQTPFLIACQVSHCGINDLLSILWTLLALWAWPYFATRTWCDVGTFGPSENAEMLKFILLMNYDYANYWRAENLSLQKINVLASQNLIGGTKF